MSKLNNARSGCRDVFHSYLVRKASYDGILEIPSLDPEYSVPMKLVRFSKAISSNDYDAWVHFYEDDALFERIWNNPYKYLPILKKFKGVITPDFSLYRDMPLVMQAWNTYRGKAIGAWLQSEGLKVICNVRTGDERTYDFCCNGVPRFCTIAVGSHGCLKVKADREIFASGLDHIIYAVHPSHIVVYGAIPDDVFMKYKNAGIDILQFDSDYAVAHLPDSKEVRA